MLPLQTGRDKDVQGEEKKVTEQPVCPRCEVRMEKRTVSRTYGNPLTIEKRVNVFTCPKCTFEAISEDEYEKIRKDVEQSKNIKAQVVIF